ncbi:hypothetical protein ACW9KT_14785 [Hymenobacter sp. HD11105]
MKKSEQEKSEKKPKKEQISKTERKAKKEMVQATTSLNDDRDDKKASQKKSLKIAAKRLQKELDTRVNEVVKRIRKETKAKLKEVVQEATRRLDHDTERMFEEALHTIVRHYDSADTTSTASAATQNSSTESASTAKRVRKPAPKSAVTLNKDGSQRKSRVTPSSPVRATSSNGKAAAKPSATTARKRPSVATTSNGKATPADTSAATEATDNQ